MPRVLLPIRKCFKTSPKNGSREHPTRSLDCLPICFKGRNDRSMAVTHSARLLRSCGSNQSRPMSPGLPSKHFGSDAVLSADSLLSSTVDGLQTTSHGAATRVLSGTLRFWAVPGELCD